MLPVEKMFQFAGGKTLLEGRDLVQALAHVAAKESPCPFLFCIRNPGRHYVSTPKSTPLEEQHMPAKDTEARLHKLERDAALIELKLRQDEYADLASDRILAEQRSDTAALVDLRSKLAEFAALEARAYAPAPVAAFSNEDAEKAAGEILLKHGLSPTGTAAMREPALGDPRSRGVAVSGGDAGQVLRSEFTDQDAERAADAILHEHGLI